MKRNWVVLTVNKPIYGDIETNTYISSTQEDALNYFKQISKKHLLQAKFKYAKKYNTSQHLSFNDYFYLARECGEFIDMGYSYTDDNNSVMISIKNEFLNRNDCVEDECLTIHMYQCNSNDNKFNKLSTNHCRHKEIDNFLSKI